MANLLPARPLRTGDVLPEEYVIVEPTDAEALLVGKVILAASRLDDALISLLASAQSPTRMLKDLEANYDTLAGKPRVLDELKKASVDDATQGTIADWVDRAEVLMDERNAYAHGILIEIPTRERLLLRRVTPKTAQRLSNGNPNGAYLLDQLGAVLLMNGLERLTREIWDHLESRHIS